MRSRQSSLAVAAVVPVLTAGLAAQTPQSARLLRFASYLGGSSADSVNALAVAPDGSVYLAGGTSSPNFPVSPGAVQRAPRGPASAFVARFRPDGSELLAATLLGGAGPATATALAVDEQGNVYVAGAAAAPDAGASGFPTTAGAHRPTAGEGFVAKLSPNLDRLLYSTLTQLAPADMAIDGEGSVYLAGTAFADFVATPGAFQTQNGGGSCSSGRTRGEPLPCPDAWVARLNPAGSELVYATRLGGSAEERAVSIAVDAQGNAWVTGETASPDFPTTANAADRRFHGRREVGPLWYGDGFVARMSPTGARLLYSTYLGGAEADVPAQIRVDNRGNAYVAGATQSRDFPVTAGAVQTTYGGPSGTVPPGSVGDGFVVKLGALGALDWATYLVGSGHDSITRLALDAEGRVHVGSASASGDFPVTPGSLPRCPAGARALYVSVLSSDGRRLERSTPVAGLGLDQINGLAPGLRPGLLLVSGVTRSLSFLATPGAFQPVYQGGDSDGFVAELDLLAEPGTFLACLVHAAALRPGGNPLFPDGAVSPGEVVTLFGTGLGPANGVGAQLAPDGSLATALAGTRVLFDGRPAPLLYASDRQVNAVVPFVLRQRTTLEVERAGIRCPAAILPLAAAAPGIFTLDGSGSGLAAALNQDGSVNSRSNPAERGSIVTFYATGLGMLDPLPPDGQVAPLRLPLPAPVLEVKVRIGGQPAEVLYAGQAPGLVAGVIQINARVPRDLLQRDLAFLDLWAGDYQNLQLSGGVVLAVR